MIHIHQHTNLWLFWNIDFLVHFLLSWIVPFLKFESNLQAYSEALHVCYKSRLWRFPLSVMVGSVMFNQMFLILCFLWGKKLIMSTIKLCHCRNRFKILDRSPVEVDHQLRPGWQLQRDGIHPKTHNQLHCCMFL